MNWLGKRYLYYIFSLLIISFSFLGIILNGFKLSLEFSGGSELELEMVLLDFAQAEGESLNAEQIDGTIRDILSQQEIEILQSEATNINTDNANASTNTKWRLSLSEITEEQKNQFLASLREKLLGYEISEIRFQSVGPALSQEILQKTLIAGLLGVGIILLYVWWQFKNWRFGIAATSAMLHDAVILAGLFTWFGRWFGTQVDLLFVTALLTTLSFSVHDTIVMFDRVRELQHTQARYINLKDLINTAVTQTIIRSINNSLTIAFMLVALILLGGSSLLWFAVALLVGTICGTYSSPFIAVSVYYDLEQRKNR